MITRVLEKGLTTEAESFLVGDVKLYRSYYLFNYDRYTLRWLRFVSVCVKMDTFRRGGFDMMKSCQARVLELLMLAATRGTPFDHLSCCSFSPPSRKCVPVVDAAYNAAPAPRESEMDFAFS